MKQILISSIFLITCISAIFSQNIQKIDSTFAIDNFLKLNVDSIEIRTFKSEKDSFSVQIIHYSIKNISKDTVIFLTNSCPSHYKCNLTINDSTYKLSLGYFCRFDNIFHHLIAPNDSFPYGFKFPIYGNIDSLKIGITNLNVIIPIMIDSIIYTNIDYDDEIISKKYRFNITELGYFICTQNLTFVGETQVVFNTVIQEPKPKRRLFRRRDKD